MKDSAETGRRIRERREQLGMTQEELGDFLSMNKSSISRLEKGLVENIKKPVLREIAEHLHVDFDYLDLNTKDFSEHKSIKGGEIMLKLKEIREEAGLSMRQVSVQAEIPASTYTAYEKGEREPNIATLIKLADFFGCSVDRILGRKEKTVQSLKPKQYNNTNTFAVQSVRVKQVIETISPFGLGGPDDPIRDIVQYWDMDGNLLGEIEKNK